MACNNALVIDFTGRIVPFVLHHVHNTIRKVRMREEIVVSVNEASIKCLFSSRLI